jgi:hypothetical protein
MQRLQPNQLPRQFVGVHLHHTISNTPTQTIQKSATKTRTRTPTP